MEGFGDLSGLGEEVSHVGEGVSHVGVGRECLTWSNGCSVVGIWGGSKGGNAG